MAAVKNWTCRIVGDRVQQWAEHQQWGFRRGRIDVLLLILTLVELAPSVNLDNSENRGSHYDNLVLIMFDYSKIQRSAAWLAFSRPGMPESLLRVVAGMRTPGGDSNVFSQEGCCSSPARCNLWHCLAMRHYRKLEDELLTHEQQQSLHVQSISGRPIPSSCVWGSSQES